MKAAVFTGPGTVELRDVPTPHAREGELILRVGANTLCGTDGRILRGEKTAGVRLGVVLGHEIGGYVTEIGHGVTGFDEGDLVGLIPTVPCGQCYYCRRGSEHLCDNAQLFGYAIDGGLAEYVRVPRDALLRGGVAKVAPHVSPVEAALGEPLACVVNGASLYRVGIGDTVLIMGAGPIGLLHTQIAKLYGASQIIVSNRSELRRLLAEQLGATRTVDPSSEDLVEVVRDLTNGRGADITVMCIGRPSLLQDALLASRKCARIHLFAGFPKGVKAEIDPNLIHYGEFEVSGTSNARRDQHELAIHLIETGAIDVKALHTDTFDLDHVDKAIDYAVSGKGIKVAVTPE